QSHESSVQRKSRDDKLREISERRIDQTAKCGAGMRREFLCRRAEDACKRNDRQGCQEEYRQRRSMNQLRANRDRHEDQNTVNDLRAVEKLSGFVNGFRQSVSRSLRARNISRSEQVTK